MPVVQKLRKPIPEAPEKAYDDMLAVNATSAYLFLKETGLHLNGNAQIEDIVPVVRFLATDGH